MLDRLLARGTVVARTDGSMHEIFPVAVPAAEGESLRDWVVRERAVTTIEVGLGYGVAALFICDALLANGSEKARHVAIDPHQTTRFGDCGLDALAEAGVGDVVEHHQERSEIALPRLLSEERRFDLAFVDGNHRFDGIFLDLTYLGQLVLPGRIIFVDDYQLPSVAHAVSFCRSNLGWPAEEISTADALHHWIVLRTASPPVQRRFDYYVEF